MSKRINIVRGANTIKLINKSDKSTFEVQKFLRYCCDTLNIVDTDLEVLIESQRTEDLETFAYYSVGEKFICVLGNGRHILDVFRSLAHELVHAKQDINGALDDTSQLGTNNDGVTVENQANSVAGIIMRRYGRENKHLYDEKRDIGMG